MCDLGEGRDSACGRLLAARAALGILNTSSHPQKEAMDMSSVPGVGPLIVSFTVFGSILELPAALAA